MLIKYIIYVILVFFLSGCVAMYAPIAWDHREKINSIIDKDPLLSALYKRYDPEKVTLRGPNGFDEVSYPSEVKLHKATYNKTTNVIYINREANFTDEELRRILIHGLCHHIWNTKFSRTTKLSWVKYFQEHPSVITRLVSLYYPQDSQNAEIFAFTVLYPQKEDIQELAELAILSKEEINMALNQLPADPKYNFWGIGMFDITSKNK